MQIPLDDDLYEALDKLGAKLGVTNEYLVELAIEVLIKANK